MVTKMISQLQESFPLKRATGSFEISFTKWLRGAKTVQLPVTFSMSCQIFSFFFQIFSELQEHLGRFPEVSESDVEIFIEGKKMETLKKDF